MGPEAIDGCSAGKVVVGEEQPETEDGFGEDVEHGVGDDFGVDINVTGSISDTPDAMPRQCSTQNESQCRESYIG